MVVTLRLGISPCPNDTFIFDALLNGLIDTGPYRFDLVLSDVQDLNISAQSGEFDLIKISYAHYFSVMDRYVMLTAGGALGFGVGPLLVARSAKTDQELLNARVAIPGEQTTARFLLRYAFPKLTHTVPMVFFDIEEAVLQGEADAGVLIHENRFTYRQKGLYLLRDLGAWWEQQTGLPIPLGGIAIRRDLAESVQRDLNLLIRESIRFAERRLPALSPFIEQHAQEMDPEVMRQHIGLYVNEQSLGLDERGKEAVQKMYSLSGSPHHLPLFAHAD